MSIGIQIVEKILTFIVNGIGNVRYHAGLNRKASPESKSVVSSGVRNKIMKNQ